MIRRIAPAMMSTTPVLVMCMLLIACGKSAPPRSVLDFEDDRAALDAKLVSCRADRRKAIDDIECQHARVAANRIAMAEEDERRNQLERDSQRQLDALRRQRAAADRQQEARDDALVESAERKISVGQSLTEAEAIAIGVDPDNSVLVDGGAEAGPSLAPRRSPGAQSQGGSLATEDATGGVTGAAVDDAGSTDPAPAAAGDESSRRSIAEIREALKSERDAEDDDDSSDDE